MSKSLVKGVAYGNGAVINCLFCNIMEGKEPGKIVMENDKYVAFKTIQPASSNHLLICPRKHVRNIEELSGVEDAQMIREMEEFGRLALGTDAEDSQYCFHIPPWNSIDHLHLHAIGARHTMSFKGSLKYWQETFYCWSSKEAAARVLVKEMSKL